MGESTAMTLATIIENASSIIGAVGDNYTTLNTDFGAIIHVPMALAIGGAIIGMIKGILFYRRSRGRR